MKDIPFPSNMEPYTGYITLVNGYISFSSNELDVAYRIDIPVYHAKTENEAKCDENVRLWRFWHGHRDEIEIGKYMLYPIKECEGHNICQHCRKKFPSFKSLIMTTKLKEFKHPYPHNDK
jgi:hypothetical protein